LQCTTLGELILAICTEDIPRVADSAPWVDPRLSHVVEKGLRRKLEERWSSVDEIAAALEPIAGGTGPLLASMLTGGSDERRSQAVPRRAAIAPTVAVAAAAVQTGPPLRSTTGGTSASSITRPGRRWGASVVVLGALALAAGAGVVWARKQARPSAPIDA